jgi:hypothetical protein
MAVVMLLLLPGSASADDPCQPYEALLAKPYVERVGKCIVSLTRTLSVPERRAFAQKLTLRALADSEHGNDYPGMPLSYYDLAELVALLNEPKTTDAVLGFIANHPESPDETRSSAVARLYELRTPLVLDRLASRSEADQKVVARSIAWGIANNFYLFINLENYKRLAVGANWEVLDAKHPHRALANRVEEEVRQLLERAVSSRLPNTPLKLTAAAFSRAGGRARHAAW